MKTDKIKKLQEASERLKSEYVGIDQQIDKIIEQVTPWYLTPEILTRPVVISLFSMTGTGKTSVVRKLLSYLEVEQQVYFNCNTVTRSSGGLDLSDLIERATTGDDGDSPGDVSPYDDQANGRSLAIVIDEFQNCRTIDEEGKEIDRAGISGVWGLIDSGIIDSDFYNYSLERLKTSIKYLEELSEAYPDTQLNRLIIQSNRKLFEEDYWYCSSKPNLTSDSIDFWKILSDGSCSTIGEVLNSVEKGLGREVLNKLYGCTTLSELLEVINSYKKYIFRPKLINCSKSLIFIIGNVDEAYQGVYENLSPDEDADVIRKITLGISTPAIKDALRYRFRIEQLSRLGNNIITYPTLGREHFKKLIDNELERLSKLVNLPITFDQNIKDLLYSEGVYPTQGARPVLSTVYDIIFPRLSEIVINGPSERAEMTSENLKDVAIIHTKIYYKDSSVKELQYEYKLSLGKIRNDKQERILEVLAFHEAGHAVVSAYLFGEVPSTIVGLTATKEGMISYDLFEPITLGDVDRSVIRSLAGYYSERQFVTSNDDCTLGSCKDIKDAWGLFSEAVYNKGYFFPDIYTADPRPTTSSGVPIGLSDKHNILEQLAYEQFGRLQNKTVEIIKKEEKLIKALASEIVKERVVTGERLKELIKTHAAGFSLESMLEVKNKRSYISIL